MGTGWSQDRETSQRQTKTDHNKISENHTETSKPTCDKSLTSNTSHHNEQLHEFDIILRNSNFPIESYTREELLTQLQRGILLNQNRQKYWVDKNGKNGFIAYGRDLSITWAEENHYWIWRQLNDGSDESRIEIAELMNVCWLEVIGKFDTKKLSPGSLYEVSFVVMMKQQSYGWDVPVNIALDLPCGGKIERKVDMSVQPKGQWVEITAGILRRPPENQLGEMKFSMYEYEGGKWKRGLVIKGVNIQPKMM